MVINPKRWLTSTTVKVNHIQTFETDVITTDDIYNAYIVAADILNMPNSQTSNNYFYMVTGELINNTGNKCKTEKIKQIYSPQLCLN